MISRKLAPFGSLEWAVLECLWERGEATAREVHDVVGTGRGLAYTTILTTLQRLAQKGELLRRGSGRAHVYSPVVTREAFAKRRGGDLAATLTRLGSAGVAAFLAEAERLDPAVVDQLRRQLEERP